MSIKNPFVFQANPSTQIPHQAHHRTENADSTWNYGCQGYDKECRRKCFDYR